MPKLIEHFRFLHFQRVASLTKTDLSTVMFFWLIDPSFDHRARCLALLRTLTEKEEQRLDP